tara:strand:+ start:1901 stop:2008 length:108 start_codon:yes stop_codon:yes gene_type:complete
MGFFSHIFIWEFNPIIYGCPVFDHENFVNFMEQKT